MKFKATLLFVLCWVIALLVLGEPRTYLPFVVGLGLCLWIDHGRLQPNESNDEVN